jgi:hypothetical protein
MDKKQNRSISKLFSLLLDDEKFKNKSFCIKRCWYVFLLLVSTIFILCNFKDVLNFTFFSEFDGKNLIFLLWLILLIIPLFDSFEGFGVKISRQEQVQAKKSKDVTNDLMNRLSVGSHDENAENLKQQFEQELSTLKTSD